MPLLGGFVVLAASYGAGLALTLGGRVAIADGLRRRATIFALGFGLLSLLVLALGLLHAFDRWVLIAVAGAFALVSLPFLAADIRRLPRLHRVGRLERWTVSLVAVVALFNVVLSAAPPTSGDALAYHLTAPKLWLHAGRMFDIWWDWSTFQPFASEMHYALGLAVGGAGAAGVVGGGLGALSTVPVYGLARELAGRRVAALAALLWVAQGMFTWEATGNFVELALAGLIALGAWHLVAFARSGRHVDAAGCGLALGVACSVKYLGLPFMALAAVGVIVVAQRTARVRVVGVFALAASVALPWYLRNAIVTGNPVYPLYTNLFGGKYWTDAVQAGYAATWSGFGVSGIWRLPIFPLEFVLHTGRYERGYSFSPGLFALAPLGLVFGARWARWLGVGVAVFLIYWWESLYQVTRYLYPVLPFLALLAAIGAIGLWERGRFARWSAGAIAAITAAACVGTVGLFAWRVLPGVVGVESQGAYVQRLTGTYDTLKWLDDRLPRNGNLLIGVRDIYYLDRPYVRFSEPLFTKNQPTDVIVARMRQYRVRYLAFYAHTLPPGLEAIRSSLRRLAVLYVPVVNSRTFARVNPQNLIVYEWRGA